MMKNLLLRYRDIRAVASALSSQKLNCALLALRGCSIKISNRIEYWMLCVKGHSGLADKISSQMECWMLCVKGHSGLADKISSQMECWMLCRKSHSGLADKC